MPHDIYGSPLSCNAGQHFIKKKIVVSPHSNLVPSTTKSQQNPETQDSPFSPLPKQSIPNLGLPSVTCLLFTSAKVSIGDKPEFSASARGMASRALANARIAYCSIVGIYQGHININRYIEANEKISHLVSTFGDGHRSTNLGSTTTVDHPVISHKVTNNTNGIVQCSLSLVNDLSIIIQLQYRDSSSH